MRRVAVGLLAALALVAGACSGGDGGDGGGSDAGGRPRRGGVLRMGIEAPRSFDPARATLPSELLVADLLFDSLTSWDPETLEVRPGIAARWEATPDQQHWDFFLRPDVVFANGRAITAADVKFTLERVASPALQLPLADQLEGVTGFGAFRSGRAPELAGVTAPAPDRVRIDLDRPLSSLPSVLGNPALGVVPREAVEAAAPVFGEQPVGSGPFAFTGRTGDVVGLGRSAGSPAHLDGIELHLQSDDRSYDAFRDDAFDWSVVPADDVESAAERYGRDAFRPLPVLSFYGFNLASPKLADVRFREAIVRAIDRGSVVNAVYGGTVRPARGVVVAGIPGAQDDPCGRRCAYDRRRARALVREAFGDGAPPEVNLDFDPSARQEAVARALQANLESVGITAHLRPHPQQTEYNDFLASGQHELFRLGWVGLYPSPDAFLVPLFASGSPNNLTGFSSPTVDGLLQQARAEADAGRRAEVYREAEREVMAQLPVLPVVQFELHAVVAERVRGLQLTAMGTFDGSKVWLSGN